MQCCCFLFVCLFFTVLFSFCLNVLLYIYINKYRYRRPYLKFSSYDTGISSGGQATTFSSVMTEESGDKRHLCPPLETPVPYEENLK